jgi:hypothetical protein
MLLSLLVFSAYRIRTFWKLIIFFVPYAALVLISSQEEIVVVSHISTPPGFNIRDASLKFSYYGK